MLTLPLSWLTCCRRSSIWPLRVLWSSTLGSSSLRRPSFSTPIDSMCAGQAENGLRKVGVCRMESPQPATQRSAQHRPKLVVGDQALAAATDTTASIHAICLESVVSL